MSDTDDNMNEIIQYCKSLPVEKQVGTDCVCALAIGEVNESYADWLEGQTEYALQKTELARDISAWEGRVNDALAYRDDDDWSSCFGPDKPRFADLKTDKFGRLQETCKNFVQNHPNSVDIICNTNSAPDKYKARFAGPDDCTWCQKTGDFWNAKLKCVSNPAYRVNDVKLTYFKGDLEVLLSDIVGKGLFFPTRGDPNWDKIHPVFRESAYKRNNQLSDSYHLLNIVMNRAPYIDDETMKLVPMDYEILNYPEYTVSDISCCSNTIICEGDCSYADFENLIQSCVIETVSNVDTDDTSSSNTATNFVPRDIFVFDTSETDRVRGLIIIIIVAVIVLVICAAVVVNQMTGI